MPITVDVGRRTVALDGRVTELTDRELAVLRALGRGAVVSRADLIRDAGLSELSARRCESLIMTLRRILGPESIVNLRRRGWRLVADVEFVGEAASPAGTSP